MPKFASQLQQRPYNPNDWSRPQAERDARPTVFARENVAGKPVHRRFGVFDAKGREWGCYHVVSIHEARTEPYAWHDSEERKSGNWWTTSFDADHMPSGRYYMSVYLHITRDDQPFGASSGAAAFANSSDAEAYIAHRIAQATKRYAKRAAK